MRYHWRVLDRTLANEPISVTMLDDIDSISFRFLQANGEWTDQWPPLNTPGRAGLRQRPRAIHFVISLPVEGEIIRIVEVAP